MREPMIGPAAWTGRLDDHVSCCAPGPDGRRVVAGSLAGDAVLIDTTSGGVQASLPPHPLGVLCAAWSADGSRFATGGQDGVVRLCTADGVPVADHQLDGWVQHMAWSPAGVLAVAAGRVLVLVDPDGSVRHRYPPVPSTITAVAWSDNGTRVGVTAYGGVTWFDSDRLPVDTAARHHAFAGSPLGLVLSPTGKWACAGYQDASIHVWPLWSGDDLAMSGYPTKIELLAFSDDGRWLASACLDELTFWDFSGKGPSGRAPAVGADHESRITWLGWRPGGGILASTDRDGALMLWPAPKNTRAKLRPVHRATLAGPVSTGAWLPDGGGLVIGHHDGLVELRPFG